jgi:hypothetical protein
VKKLLLLVYMVFAPVMTAAAASSTDCLTSKYHAYAQAQETWQRKLTQLIVQVAPRYQEVAQTFLTDQLQAIERAELAVDVLARENPDRLRTDMSVSNWLDLTEDDRRHLAQSSKRYAELLGLREISRNRPPHPDGDALRELMRSTVMSLPEYKELLAEYSRAVDAADRLQCKQT